MGKIQGDAEYYLENLIKSGSDDNLNYNEGVSDVPLPPWYNEEKYKMGQEFYCKNKAAIIFSELIATITLLSVPSMLNILIHTNLTSTPENAYNRYLTTIHYFTTWYEDELKPGTRSWKTFSSVRRQHFYASKGSKKSNIGFINQKDLALSQFLFAGFVTIRSNYFGIQIESKESLNGFFHFWRVIGYILGLKDEYNLLTDSVTTNIDRFELILKQIIRPHLEESTNLKNYYKMVDTLVKGLSALNPIFDTDSMIYFTKMLANCTDHDYFGSDINFYKFDDSMCRVENVADHRKPIYMLSYKSRFNLWTCMVTYYYLMNFYIYRWFQNKMINIVLWLSLHFPLVPIIKFGKKKAFIKVIK